MNINELLQALQYSVGKTQEEVRLAEQYLLQAKTAEGYIPNLLLIACNKEVALFVRQAASIYLKTTVQEGWTKSVESNKGVPVADKETLRESLLEAIIKCADTPKVYRQLEEVIKCIACIDFPNNWKNILPNVVNILKGSDKFAEILGALLTLKNIVANYKFAVEAEREILELIATNTFPLLEVYAKNLLDNYTEETAVAMHVILKIVHASLETDLPKYFFDEKVLESWMTFFKVIVDKSLGTELESQTESQNVIRQRARHVFWLNKKNSLRILATWLARYTLYKPTAKKNKLSDISQLFIDKYAVSFLESCVQILYKRKEQHVPVKVLYFAMKYVFRAMNFTNLSDLLANHLEPLLFEYLIPVMFLTVDDDDDWNNNPIEFVRKEDDANERPNNIKSPAKDFFITICAKDSFAPDGELFLLKFMKYAAHVLTANVDPRTNQQTDLRMKEALMHIIGLLKSPILKNSYLKENMEVLLEKYVLPELKNSIGFLRYRACWLVGIYGGLRYKKTENITVAVEGLFNCLQDSEFAVKVKAGIAMSSLLRQPEAIEILKPGLQKILQIYITLIDMMGNDDLVVAFEGIIEKFEDEMHPYAIELAEHLTKTFFKVHYDNQEDDGVDSDDGAEATEKGFAANEYLSAIARIISCELKDETLAKLEEIVLPIIEFILTEEGMDCIEPGLEILVELLYRNDVISEKLWQVYPELNYIIAGKPDALIRDNFSHLSEEKQELMRQQAEGWAYEFIDRIIPCFQNYIQKGGEFLFTARDPHFNITYLELLLKTIERIYQLSITKKNYVEPTIITVLFLTILENYPKQVNDLVPYIIDKVVTYGNNDSTDFKKALIEAVAMCFWYDAELTFQTLESKKITEHIFKAWMEVLPEYNTDFECQRTMFGLASIFKLNVSNIPQVVVSSLPGIVKEMIKLTSKILDLRNLNEDDVVEDAEDDDTEKQTLEKLKQINQKNEQQGNEEDDEADDDDFNDLENFEPGVKGQYSSPIEDTCEILFMKECFTYLQQNQTDAYNQLISCLSDEEKKTLQENIQEAEEQQLEFEKYKQEEEQKRQMKSMNRA